MSTETKRTATYVKTLTGFNGDAQLFRIDPPSEYEESGYDGNGDYFEGIKPLTHVVASAVVAPHSGPEVLLFPATPEGEVITFAEVGGQRGTLEHDLVLSDMGWEVVR